MDLELTRPAPRRRQRGFSLVEALVASLLLVVIVLALVPLFARSMSNTLAGREYSVASQHGRSRVDEYYQLPLEHEELLLPVGDGELVRDDWWDVDDKRWTDVSPPSPPAWGRVTTVRQYSVNDLLLEGRLFNPLAGGSPAPQVHLREVIVEVESEREGGAAGSGKSISLTTVRGF